MTTKSEAIIAELEARADHEPLARAALLEIRTLRTLLRTGLALHGGIASTYSEITWRVEARNALGIKHDEQIPA